MYTSLKVWKAPKKMLALCLFLLITLRRYGRQISTGKRHRIVRLRSEQIVYVFPVNILALTVSFIGPETRRDRVRRAVELWKRFVERGLDIREIRVVIRDKFLSRGVAIVVTTRSLIVVVIVTLIVADQHIVVVVVLIVSVIVVVPSIIAWSLEMTRDWLSKCPTNNPSFFLYILNIMLIFLVIYI